MKYFFEIERDHSLTREQADTLRKFYMQIPQNGNIGNVTLRELLGIEGEEYWSYRDLLIEAEKIDTARGKGGSVYRIPREKGNEMALEIPMLYEIQTRWAEQRGYLRQGGFCKTHKTARQGARPTGRLSRPDITLLGGRTYPNLPAQKFLDVVTFEIKPWVWLDGVYEALAHQRRANLSYLICSATNTKDLPAVRREAERQGIGLILAPEEDLFETWTELVKPERHDPDPHALDEFLREQMAEHLDALREWLRDA